MSGTCQTCQTCQFWDPEPFDGQQAQRYAGYGVCERITTYRDYKEAGPPTDTAMIGMNDDPYVGADFVTHPTFGCNLFTPMPAAETVDLVAV